MGATSHSCIMVTGHRVYSRRRGRDLGTVALILVAHWSSRARMGATCAGVGDIDSGTFTRARVGATALILKNSPILWVHTGIDPRHMAVLSDGDVFGGSSFFVWARRYPVSFGYPIAGFGRGGMYGDLFG
jgi:hypothetical protein